MPLAGHLIHRFHQLRPCPPVGAVVLNHHVIVLIKINAFRPPHLRRTSGTADITTFRIAPHQAVQIADTNPAGRLLREDKLPAMNNPRRFIFTPVPVNPRSRNGSSPPQPEWLYRLTRMRRHQQPRQWRCRYSRLSPPSPASEKSLSAWTAQNG